VEPSRKTTEQQVCEQHFITHTTQQHDGRFVARLPTKMDIKLRGISRLAAERRLHAFEHRMKQELKVQYHYFMSKSKGLEHRYPVKSQEGRKMLLSNNRPVYKEISSTKTLVLQWNPTIDQLQVKNNTTQVQATNTTAIKKR